MPDGADRSELGQPHRELEHLHLTESDSDVVVEGRVEGSLRRAGIDTRPPHDYPKYKEHLRKLSGNPTSANVQSLSPLSWPSKGARDRAEESAEAKKIREDRIADAVRVIISELGEDPERSGLKDTPKRYARALLDLTDGYQENIVETINGALFEEDHDEMVLVRDISVYSLCEHHLVPFHGKIHIAYIPKSRVIGLSKLARIAEMFSRRLQVQERLTKQVAMALWEALDPQGVAVVMEASHMCMEMRGVRKPGASTVTSCMLGCFRDRQRTREEFLSLLRH